MSTMLKRRLLYGVFIVVFLFVAPLLILYASGYRYNDRIGIVQKTGAIFVNVTPKDVNIFLNNELVEDLGTDLRITQLLPEEYDVRITADGYRDWNRMVTVSPFETTFLTDIQLFLNNSLPEYIDALPEDVLEYTKTTPSIQKGVYTFTAEPIDGSYELISSHAVTGDKNILTVIPSGLYSFVDVADPWVVLYDQKHHLLYFFELSNNKDKIINRVVLSDVRGFDVHKDKTRVAAYTPLELWTVDLGNEGRQRLVTRLSTGIQQAVWHPGGGYLYYQTGDIIRVVELVSTVHQEQYDLATVSGITDLMVSKEGDILYFKATIGNQVGWHRLRVQ